MSTNQKRKTMKKTIIIFALLATTGLTATAQESKEIKKTKTESEVKKSDKKDIDAQD